MTSGDQRRRIKHLILRNKANYLNVFNDRRCGKANLKPI